MSPRYQLHRKVSAPFLFPFVSLGHSSDCFAKPDTAEISLLSYRRDLHFDTTEASSCHPKHCTQGHFLFFLSSSVTCDLGQYKTIMCRCFMICDVPVFSHVCWPAERDRHDATVLPRRCTWPQSVVQASQAIHSLLSLSCYAVLISTLLVPLNTSRR